MKQALHRKLVSALALTTLISVGVSVPVKAQSSWLYSPYTGQSTWLMLARGLSYPLNRLTTSSVPLYLINPFIYNASYGATQALGGRSRRQFGTYNDPYTSGMSQSTGQNGAGPTGVTDQVAYQKRAASSQDQALLDGADAALTGSAKPSNQPVSVPPAVPTGNPASPDFLPMPAPVPYSGSPGWSTSGSNSAPPVAPNVTHRSRGRRFSRKNDHAQGTWSPPPAEHATGSSPMAQGFIVLVNSKYAGDISRALYDPEMRSYAKAIGLVDSDKTVTTVSPDRSALIKQILADQKEDPLSRINAVRLLLKH